MYLSESLHLYEVADYWRAIINMNEHQKQRFTRRIISCLYNNLAGKKLAVLGFAFKKDTNDTRESPAITLVSNFIAERARVAIYDPQVPSQQIWRELVNNGCDLDLLERNVSVCPSSYAACEAADAVVVVTEWDEFSNKSAVLTPNAIGERRPLARQHLASTDTNKATPYAPLRRMDQNASSLLISKVEAAASFQIPSKKSSGIAIKDPNSGEIKSFNVQPTPSGSSALQSSFGHSANIQSPPRQSLGWTPILANARSNEHMTSPQSPSGESFMVPAKPAKYGTAQATDNFPETASPIDERLQAVEIATSRASANNLDWARIAKGMRKPMFVFDGRNMLDHGKLEELGFRVEAIGKRGRGDSKQHA